MEGCQGFEFPPEGEIYYENLFQNDTYKSVPQWTLDRIEVLLNEVVPILEKDFPIGYKQDHGDEGVYFGSAGRAAMYLRLYRNSKDKSFLQLARGHIDVALDRFSKEYNPQNFAFLKGRPGVCAVASVIYDIMNEPKSKIKSFHDEIIAFFLKVQVTDQFDLENGMAGLLYASRYLKRYFGTDIVPVDYINRVGTLIFEQGMLYQNETSGVLLFPEYLGHHWTGMGSHGLGSPIFELMQCDDLMKNETIRKHVIETIDYLVGLQTPDGQIPGDMPHRTQWCHGIPGLLSVLGLAYEIFQDERYYSAVMKGVNFTASEGILVKGMQLCHGVSGNTYMLIDAFRRTQNSLFLSQAISMIMTSVSIPKLTDPKYWISYDCMPYMLYGSSSMGMTVFFSDILHHYDDLSLLEMPGFHTSV